MFSIVIPGSASLSPPAQALFAVQIASAFQGPGFTSNVAGVTAFNGTSAIVNGYAYAVWTVTPTVTELAIASSLRDSFVSKLSINTTIVLNSFAGAYANAACNGMSTVTTLSNEPLVYSTNVTVPGPLQCGAKLIYPALSDITNQIGIDNGLIIASNRGKYCSTPAVTGGAVGIPGSGSCIQYGVLAAGTGVTAANVGKLCSLNPINLSGSIAVNTPIVAGVTITGQCTTHWA